MSAVMEFRAGQGGNRPAIPTSVVIKHKLLDASTPAREFLDFNSIANTKQALDIYYAVNTRYRKCALVLCMTALAKGLEPVKFQYHKDKRVGTLFCVDRSVATPDGKPWPVVLDVQEITVTE